MNLLEKGAVIGRYTILGKLAAGGMSEIYLARQSGPSGFSKVVVIKVIHPHHAEDESFLGMFENEAKLAALINHPNVVQVFDFGAYERTYYMAMEYIDGVNLRNINQVFKQKKLLMPIPIILRICSDACGALDFAHTLTGPDGRPLQIIHRDVSLDNILLTYSGQVKLVDFGIAKAQNLDTYTSQGQVKGKFGYMAPETIEIKKLDHRVDIYAMGIILYRLLLGTKPFLGDNPAQLMQQILTAKPKPPRELDPELPVELEQIILKAMAKERRHRYQRASELQADLEAFLRRGSEMVLSYELSQFMSEVFPPGTDQSRKLYCELAGISLAAPTNPTGFFPDEQSSESLADQLHSPPPPPLSRATKLPSAQLPEEGGTQSILPEQIISPDALSPFSDDTPLAKKGNTASQYVESGIQDDIPSRPTFLLPQEPPAIPPRQASTLFNDPNAPNKEPTGTSEKESTFTFMLKRRSRMLAAIFTVVVLISVGAIGGRFLFPDHSSKKININSDSTLSTARVSLDLSVPTSNEKLSANHTDAASEQIKEAKETEAKETEAKETKESPENKKAETASATKETKKEQKTENGALSVSAPPPAIVTLSGRRLGQVPIINHPIPAGEYRLQVVSAKLGYRINQNVTIKPNNKLELRLAPQQGRFNLQVRPWAQVTLDGKSLGMTPIKPLTLYVGEHKLLLENNDLKIKRQINIQIKPNQETVLKLRLP